MARVEVDEAPHRVPNHPAAEAQAVVLGQQVDLVEIAAPVVPRLSIYSVNGKEYLTSFVHSTVLGADISTFTLP